MLQITFAFVLTREVNKKREGEKNVVTNFMKALLSLNWLIADAITFIIIETVRTSKCSKLNSFL